MICDKDKCTGCFACYNICPKNAIKMVEDEYGYIYPVIDDKLCVNCKLCQKNCPSLNKVNLEYPIKCYASRVINEDILKKSTSGGIATLLSKKMIENGGIVYGAAYVGNCEVNHIRVDNIDELHKLQGSKYVHSYIKDTFRLVKKDLIDKNNVLFIGTPCQIAGLKKYLINEYENLYTVDIICHGVPSQEFLKNEVRRINNNSIDIDRVNFRDKVYDDFTFSLEKNNKVDYSEKWTQNPYFYTFMEAITYRENCYNCLYARPERVSDITIGDFWGLGKNSKFYNSKEKGVSILLPVTQKGVYLIQIIKDEIELEERTIEEAINGNGQLREHSKKGKSVDKFKDLYIKNNDFYKTYRKVCKKHCFKEKIKSISMIKYVLKLRKEIRNEKK